jgi:hypothetical protein
MDETTRALIAPVWSNLCARLASGELVRDVLKAYSITSGQQRAYLRDAPGARQEWDDAREASADAYHDEAVTVARGDDVANLPEGERALRARDPQAARLLVDTLKWAARVRNPRVYSEKQTVDLNVRSVDLTAIIRDANARLAAAREPKLIEQVRDDAVRALPVGAESMLAAIL